MTDTVLARDGRLLSYDWHMDDLLAYLNGGGYTDEQCSALADAMMAATTEEVNALLPEGCAWWPRTSEIIGPVDGVDLDEGLDAALRAAGFPRQNEDIFEDVVAYAAARVTARFDTIERGVLSR